MKIEILETVLNGNCPLCGARIELPQNTEESEILACPDCQSMLVVDSRNGSSMVLNEAPRIEEDWGQ